jgi:aerobic carbon-monoxide dehydrogenase medium subunit
MKPAPFEYIAPGSVDEAVEALARHGDSAKILAGGQSLVPMLNMRLVRPSVLVTLRRVAELQYVAIDERCIRVGSMTRQRALEHDGAVLKACPVVSEALGLLGHPAIRNQGTVGGSVAHADPAAELPAVLVALDGAVTLFSTRGRRSVPASDFFRGLLATAAAPDELITELTFNRVGRPGVASGWAVEEVSRRHGDFALAGAIAGVTVEPDGRVADARIAVFSVEPSPTRRRAAEARVTGSRCDAETVAEAAAVAVQGLDPLDDLHASGRFRVHLAVVLVRRALERAYRKAGGDD